MRRALILLLFLCGLAAGAAGAENGAPSASAPPAPQKQSPAEAQLGQQVEIAADAAEKQTRIGEIRLSLAL